MVFIISEAKLIAVNKKYFSDKIQEKLDKISMIEGRSYNRLNTMLELYHFLIVNKKNVLKYIKSELFINTIIKTVKKNKIEINNLNFEWYEKKYAIYIIDELIELYSI